MRYAYETLLHLYPDSYRAVFGQEMASVFEQATSDYPPRRFLAYLAFVYSEFSGLIAGAFSMRAGEFVLRTRSRLNVPFAVSLFLGSATAALTQGCVLNQIGHLGRHELARAQILNVPQGTPDPEALFALAGGTLVFLSLFSGAFVWNLRNLRRRKP
jgi:hypothetical protein